MFLKENLLMQENMEVHLNDLLPLETIGDTF